MWILNCFWGEGKLILMMIIIFELVIIESTVNKT